MIPILILFFQPIKSEDDQLKDLNQTIMDTKCTSNGIDDSDREFELDESDNLGKETVTIETSKQSSIKEKLRMKIQTRRLSEGQEELKVEFEPPKKYMHQVIWVVSCENVSSGICGE